MSKKIISVHNHPCTTGCPHKDVCYFVNGKHFDTTEKERTEIGLKIEDVINNISHEYDVYYSGCDLVPSFFTYASFIHGHEDHKHMTMSVVEFEQMKNMVGKDDGAFEDNVQMTVYTMDDLKKEEYLQIQKMFLIKDEETFNIAMDVFENHNDFANIHFPIEHNWAVQNPYQLGNISGAWNRIRGNDNNLSLDSCLENYLVNGKCVYADDYIDLRYDGSVRRCPFSDECHKINYDNPDAMFDIEFKPHCIYGELFGREEWRNGNSQK